jgi:oligopeptide/dipeptide ABC transporter ATP-binding protein
MVPSLREPIAGCAFATRCPHAVERCRVEPPPLEAKADGHTVACWEADRLPVLSP